MYKYSAVRHSWEQLKDTTLIREVGRFAVSTRCSGSEHMSKTGVRPSPVCFKLVAVLTACCQWWLLKKKSPGLCGLVTSCKKHVCHRRTKYLTVKEWNLSHAGLPAQGYMSKRRWLWAKSGKKQRLKYVITKHVETAEACVWSHKEPPDSFTSLTSHYFVHCEKNSYYYYYTREALGYKLSVIPIP